MFDNDDDDDDAMMRTMMDDDVACSFEHKRSGGVCSKQGRPRPLEDLWGF